MGDLSTSATFTVTLVDPCPTTLLTINNPVPFVTGECVLRDNQIERVWDIDALVSRATLVDCGPLTVEFFDENTGATPAAAVFDDIRTTPNAFSYASKNIQDVALKGDYPIKYRAYHTNYAADNNIVELDTAFVITVVDPCEDRASIVH